jgi:hypothetical protein
MIYLNATKKRRLVHPIWTHLPALAALAVFLVCLFMTIPLPSSTPVHFGFDGEPDRYGNPWGFVWFIIGFSLFFIGLSGFLDEAWARQEKKKSFNWLCWLDDITVGWIAAVGAGYLLFLRDGGYNFTLPWGLIAIMGGGAVVVSIILELLRPYRPYNGKPAVKEIQLKETELARQIKDDTTFVYWENQNPFYVTLLSIVIPLICIASAGIVWFNESGTLFTTLFSVFMVLLGVMLMVFIFSGQRVTITRQELTVRWGAIGLKVLRLNIMEITALELYEFQPLKDFGGYGIRYGRGMKAYYLRGDRGVKLTMTNGKKYLVGSDHAERLFKVLELTAGKKQHSPV